MTEKPDPFDVAALERSLNDSATRVSTIWVSYLIFALYLLIATSTATHRQLLLEEPLKLPALNIDLPLYWFFILAPILFVLLHFYVLLQVLLLGRTAAAYNEIVDKAIGSAPENALMRQRLANTLFAQIFAGSPREREGWLGWLLRAMAWTTLALAPIYIILAFQFVFLPYHSHPATWIHRLLLFAEVAIAFLLWPLVLDARKDFDWRKLLQRIKRTVAVPIRLLSARDQRSQEWHRLRMQTIPVITCISFLAVSLSLASFPGEPHVNLFTGNSPFAVQCDRWISQKWDRLVLQGVAVFSNEKLDRIERTSAAKDQKPSESERTTNFEERELSCITFISVDLRRTNFALARMSGARLPAAELQGANLKGAQLEGADFRGAQLQGANLGEAQLQGANLSFAQLQGADLSEAQLEGANLSFAHIEGADLSDAQLQGAVLSAVGLMGSNLQTAQLQGAVLRTAQLQGADLRGAQLQGVDLGPAQREMSQLGVDITELKGADLQGANLDGAQLQGSSFSNSELKLASLSGVYLWRVRHANCSDARVIAPKLEAALSLKQNAYSEANTVPVTSDEIEKFIEDYVADIGNDRRKHEARERLREGLVSTIEKDDLAKIETSWRDCAANSEKITESDYLKQHADFLRDLVCNASFARKEIANGIIENWIWHDPDRRDYNSRLARGLLGRDGKDCAATQDLSDNTKARLHEVASTPAR